MKAAHVRSIVTSASNKFFPSVLNLVGSIKEHYPDHPPIHIWDLGLFTTFRKELASIENVQVHTMPAFVPHWRICYTWKPYIFAHPHTEITLYLDAGTVTLRSLDPLFEYIEKNGYLLVGQETACDQMIPTDYYATLAISDDIQHEELITAGIFGFSKHSLETQKVIERLHAAAQSGLCLGYSKNEQWKNTGVNKNPFVRDCPIFRHDTTLLTMFAYDTFKNPYVWPVRQFHFTVTGETDQYIHNVRLFDYELPYVAALKRNSAFPVTLNRLYLTVFKILKRINRWLKKL